MTSADQGESDLQALLLHMEPQLLPLQYVFCTTAHDDAADLSRLSPLAVFHEAEGISAVVPLDVARDSGLSHSAPMRCISLNVHSSLEAVGLTAAVANALAGEGISANVVAAYYHDHVFVPADRAEQALAVLNGLSVR